MPGPLKKTVYSSAKTYALSDGDQALQSIRKRKILPIQLMPGLLIVLVDFIFFRTVKLLQEVGIQSRIAVLYWYSTLGGSRTVYVGFEIHFKPQDAFSFLLKSLFGFLFLVAI